MYCTEARLEALGGYYKFSQPRAPRITLYGITLPNVLNALPKPDLGVLLMAHCTLLGPAEVFAILPGFKRLSLINQKYHGPLEGCVITSTPEVHLI